MGLRRYVEKAGKVNTVVIVLIAVAVGLLSCVSLMSQEQAEEVKRHIFSFFFRRLCVLMAVSGWATAGLLLLNVVVQLLWRRRINVPVLSTVLVLSLFMSCVAICCGLLLLCSML